MKCKTREEAVQRYGAIDFSAHYWREQNVWLHLLTIQDGWFPNWKVLDTQYPVRHILVNYDMMGPLTTALKQVHDSGMGDLLTTFDGCFNIRMVRGNNSLFSAHSYGLAIDLNASSNPLGSVAGGFYDLPKFVECFTDNGFSWGGSWIGRRDPMHYSYCWE